MTRKPRIEFPGAVYHVIVRGNNREDIFNKSEEKRRYLKTIEKYKKKYPFTIYAYVIMPNHVHLLIKVGETPLSKIMQGIQMVYTLYYNAKYDRVGHVFQQRYKAKLCDKEEYFLTLISYIHQNPVKAGLSKDLMYFWSSHKDYLHPDKTDFVDSAFPLSLFDQNGVNATKKYQRFLADAEENKPDIDDIALFTLSALQQKSIYGKVITFPLDAVLEFVAEETEISKAAIISKSRQPRVVLARQLFIYIATDHCQKNLTEIAGFINLSLPAVSKAKALDVSNKEEKEKYFHSCRDKFIRQNQGTSQQK